MRLGEMSFPPERIICLTEETVETLYLLGEDRRIVGVSGYAVRPPRVRREKPRVSAFISADIDKILELIAIQIGTDQLLVMARVSVRDEIPAGDVERLMVRLGDRLRREHPEVTDSFIELAPASA